MIINRENYFDYAEAIHCFATLNHDGQTSVLYSILSRSEFKPGLFWSKSEVELNNPVYGELTESNVVDLFEELMTFLERL